MGTTHLERMREDLRLVESALAQFSEATEAEPDDDDSKAFDATAVLTLVQSLRSFIISVEKESLKFITVDQINKFRDRWVRFLEEAYGVSIPEDEWQLHPLTNAESELQIDALAHSRRLLARAVEARDVKQMKSLVTLIKKSEKTLAASNLAAGITFDLAATLRIMQEWWSRLLDRPDVVAGQDTVQKDAARTAEVELLYAAFQSREGT